LKGVYGDARLVQVRFWLLEELFAAAQIFCSVSVGKNAVVADSDKTGRKNMHQEASDKLLG